MQRDAGIKIGRREAHDLFNKLVAQLRLVQAGERRPRTYVDRITAIGIDVDGDDCAGRQCPRRDRAKQRADYVLAGDGITKLDRLIMQRNDKTLQNIVLSPR